LPAWTASTPDIRAGSDPALSAGPGTRRDRVGWVPRRMIAARLNTMPISDQARGDSSSGFALDLEDEEMHCESTFWCNL